MKRIFFLLCLAVPSALFAQQPAYTFTVQKDNEKGPTENQCASGTCWSFATISFLESEILRKGGEYVDLSEMYNVRLTYPMKAASFVRYQGKQQFGPGGLSHDAIAICRESGLVPEEAYSGLKGKATEHDHGTLDAVLEAYVKAVLDAKLNERGGDWMTGLHGILDAYLGSVPAQFDYKGKTYTPQSFRDAMGIRPEEYISLTSFSHRPWYAPFVLEVPDNWAKGSFYNLPMNELVQVMDFAIANGYTVAWDADVSEKGFSFGQGVAILPADSVKREDYFKRPVTEKIFSESERQAMYESFATTDDHLMHITGAAQDQNGRRYYRMKNSWGTNNIYNGYQFVSMPYFQFKTVSIVVHRDAIPAEIRKKLGL